MRVAKCMKAPEWEVAKRFRQRYFFDRVPITDPYTWTFSHADHAHFVLYGEGAIVGYAHMQLWPALRAAMRIIVVEESQRLQGYGRQLARWLESWLKSEGYRSIHVEASPGAVGFYRRIGYTEMPFNDPDEYAGDPSDTAMGKLLS